MKKREKAFAALVHRCTHCAREDEESYGICSVCQQVYCVTCSLHCRRCRAMICGDCYDACTKKGAGGIFACTLRTAGHLSCEHCTMYEVPKQEITRTDELEDYMTYCKTCYLIYRRVDRSLPIYMDTYNWIGKRWIGDEK